MARPLRIQCLRRELIDLARQNANTRNSLAWTLSLQADLAPDLAELAVELAREATDLTPDEDGFWNTRGLAEYRAGNWQAANEAVLRSIERSKAGPEMADRGNMEIRKLSAGGEGGPFDWLALAMSEWQLGNPEEARHWYAKATAYAQTQGILLEIWGAREDLNRLSAEAAEVLGLANRQAGGE